MCCVVTLWLHWPILKHADSGGGGVSAATSQTLSPATLGMKQYQMWRSSAKKPNWTSNLKKKRNWTSNLKKLDFINKDRSGKICLSRLKTSHSSTWAYKPNYQNISSGQIMFFFFLFWTPLSSLMSILLIALSKPLEMSVPHQPWTSLHVADVHWTIEAGGRGDFCNDYSLLKKIDRYLRYMHHSIWAWSNQWWGVNQKCLSPQCRMTHAKFSVEGKIRWQKRTAKKFKMQCELWFKEMQCAITVTD